MGTRGDLDPPNRRSADGSMISNFVLFGRMLRRAGLGVDAGQTRLFAEVVARLGFDHKRDVKAAGRTIFVKRREERPIYDAAFDLFFRRTTAQGPPSELLPRIRQLEQAQQPGGAGVSEDPGPEV